MDLTAVIAVRGGSTRVKDKNIRPFAGSSLLEVKIEQLKKVHEIEKILVTSDSDKLLEIAEKHGVTAKKRPAEYCDEKSLPFNEVVKFIASKQVDTKYMIWTPCVCPLVTEKYISKGIRLYRKQLEGKMSGEGICTVTPFKEYLISEKGPVNYSVEHFVRSQDLPDWSYIINGFFIAQTMQMFDWGVIYGKNPYTVSIPKEDAIDIDDPIDFEIAEMLYISKTGGYRLRRTIKPYCTTNVESEVQAA